MIAMCVEVVIGKGWGVSCVLRAEVRGCWSLVGDDLPLRLAKRVEVLALLALHGVGLCHLFLHTLSLVLVPVSTYRAIGGFLSGNAPP